MRSWRHWYCRRRQRAEAGSLTDRGYADGTGMLAPDRDRHPADADRERVAAERPEVQEFDHHAFVEAELAQAVGLAFAESGPVNRRDARLRPDRKTVEPNHVRLKRRVH